MYWWQSQTPSGGSNPFHAKQKNLLRSSGQSVNLINNGTGHTEVAKQTDLGSAVIEQTTNKLIKRSSKMSEQTGTVVEMEDGGSEVFGGKKKMLKDTRIAEDGSIATKLSFSNGRVISFTIPADMILRFAAHGVDQKFGDEIAGLGDIDDCVLAIEELADRIAKGEWSMKRESSGLGGTSVLAKALMEMTGKDAQQVKEFLAGKNQAEKLALRNNPKVQPFVAKIEAAKTNKGAGIDTEALLGELG